MNIKTIGANHLSHNQIKQINDLTDSTWPRTKPAGKTEEERKQLFLNRNPNKTCFLGLENERLVSYCEIFNHTLNTSKGALNIVGLASVCVDPTLRGKGLGAKIVQAAFREVDKSGAKVSFFQTGVPKFYSLLNCKEVNNKIINSLNSESPDLNPFWEDHAMVYPATFEWPEGTIDLMGAGY